jgi:hypothetical protein
LAFALGRDFGVDHDERPALRQWRYFRVPTGFLTMTGIPDYHRAIRIAARNLRVDQGV